MLAESLLRARLLLTLIAPPLLGGCAAVPYAVAGAGDIKVTSATAYRTFTHSRTEVRAAALRALALMQIALLRDAEKGGRIKIKGKTEHLKISIVLTPVTPVLTKAAVQAERNWLMQDQTVAAEILVQVGRILERSDSGRSSPGG